MGQLIVILALFALLWLFLIRPQRKRQLEQQELQASIEVGDEILTVGGLYGDVRELLEDDDLLVEVAPGTRVRIARRAVAGVVEVEEDEPVPDDPAAGPEERAAEDAAQDDDGTVPSPRETPPPEDQDASPHPPGATPPPRAPE